jgi:hypothetical protein
MGVPFADSADASGSGERRQTCIHLSRPDAATIGLERDYLRESPDGGLYRRSNYARRVFRPACDGRYEPGPGRRAPLVIADANVWPGVPVAMWPAAQPCTGPSADLSAEAATRRAEAAESELYGGHPLSCWLPVKPGLTPQEPQLGRGQG